MKELTQILKACADEKRMRIVALLHKRAMCVCELAYVLGISQPAVSKHIKKMTEASLIVGEQDGFWTNYSLCPESVCAQQLVAILKTALADDAVVAKDAQKAATADKKKLCCK